MHYTSYRVADGPVSIITDVFLPFSSLLYQSNESIQIQSSSFFPSSQWTKYQISKSQERGVLEINSDFISLRNRPFNPTTTSTAEVNCDFRKKTPLGWVLLNVAYLQMGLKILTFPLLMVLWLTILSWWLISQDKIMIKLHNTHANTIQTGRELWCKYTQINQVSVNYHLHFNHIIYASAIPWI